MLFVILHFFVKSCVKQFFFHLFIFRILAMISFALVIFFSMDLSTYDLNISRIWVTKLYQKDTVWDVKVGNYFENIELIVTIDI